MVAGLPLQAAMNPAPILSARAPGSHAQRRQVAADRMDGGPFSLLKNEGLDKRVCQWMATDFESPGPSWGWGCRVVASP